jgi:hypothetical protein
MHTKHSTNACVNVCASVVANAIASAYRDNSSCIVRMCVLPIFVDGNGPTMSMHISSKGLVTVVVIIIGCLV